MSRIIEHGDYYLENVYETEDQDIRQEIIDFWVNNNVLPVEIAQKRVDEIVHVIRNRSDEIIGVNTAYLHYLHTPSEIYYYVRVFIREEDRRSMTLFLVSIVQSYVYFRDTLPYSDRANGIVVAIENVKMTQSGVQKWFKRQGLSYTGKNVLGHDLWFARFDDPLLQHLK